MYLPKKSILGLGLLIAANQSSNATIVFSDDFSSSTINLASNPTATSTSYAIASSKNATPAISTGDLRIGFPATTSGFVEAQARFATTPVSLATVGDSITLMATFTSTTNILSGTAAAGSSLFVGLYNSGSPSTAPLTNLTTSGLSSALSSPNSTGGVQLWQGYVSRIAPNGDINTRIYTRPAQSGADTSSQNQDLIGNNFGGGAYDTPQGNVLGSGVDSTLVLTDNGQYTLNYMIALTGAGTYSITSQLFAGAGTGGSNLFSKTETATGVNFLTSEFDGLALGYRYSGASSASRMDVNSILITTESVPEPNAAVLILSSLATVSLLRRRTR